MCHLSCKVVCHPNRQVAQMPQPMTKAREGSQYPAKSRKFSTCCFASAFAQSGHTEPSWFWLMRLGLGSHAAGAEAQGEDDARAQRRDEPDILLGTWEPDPGIPGPVAVGKPPPKSEETSCWAQRDCRLGSDCPTFGVLGYLHPLCQGTSVALWAGGR